MKLPQAFLARMKERLGEGFPAFSASYERAPYKGLRVNTLKISAEEFAARAPFPLGDRIGGVSGGFYIGEERPGADPYHFAGLYYLQEPSAMTVGKFIDAGGGKRVLDLCAAPGGKTTQIAARMAGEGVLVANEIVYDRAKILSQNVERLGISNCAVTSATPETLARAFPAYFDLIVADAPCSGEGMFLKEPNAIPEWSEANVLRCAARQRDILDRAAEMLAAGGTLVYSTCTFAEEEDEWQVADFLKRHPGFSYEGGEKLYPHAFRGEGHFCALLKKQSDIAPVLGSPRWGSSRVAGEGVKPCPVRHNAAAERAFSAFAEVFSAPPQGEISTLSDGRMYLVPEGMPDLSSVRLLRLGVELGEWDGKVFKPAHALAMAFGTRAERQLRLSRTAAEKYLHGETLGADLPNGWCVVCVEEFPLGFGKCVDGVVKNHLPKGLRKIT